MRCRVATEEPAARSFIPPRTAPPPMALPACRGITLAPSLDRLCRAISAGRSLSTEPRQPVVPPTMTAPQVDPEQQRRLAEQEAARTSRVFFQSAQARATAPSASAASGFSGLGAVGPGGTPSAPQDRQLAFLNAAVDRRVVASDRVMAPASPYVLQAGAVIPGRADHRHPLRPAGPRSPPR